jgi:serine/threonine protein kinase
MLLSTPMTVPCLSDRYELMDRIGGGSFAEVFAALDRTLGVVVAVKILRAELATSKTHLAAFAAEAAISSRMQSPHIVKVLAIAVTEDNRPCIVYEHLVGETLAQRIDRDGALTLAMTRDIIAQLARALSRVHALGMVHRDVKPENVFLCETPNGRPLVKLIDFGIAMRDRAPRTEGLGDAGTPAYVAPEMLGAAKVDRRSDVYALGAVAFECLTGVEMVSGTSVGEILESVRAGRRRSLLERRPEIASLETWLDQAVHPDPSCRFVSPRELAERLALEPTPSMVSFAQAA